ncbi:MAG: TIGR02147 family protein [Bdellovibrionaceae bacterium]|nr:TIGR02147 family protein [Pseudobdellovibrionaceae bacterium]
MLNVYDYQEYRKLLRDEAARRKKERPGWTLQRIAEKAEVQAPYLTNVLKERAHLQSDQLYALAQIFEWDEEQTDYAQMLLEQERSGNLQRRKHLLEKLNRIRREKMRTKAHLKAELVEEGAPENMRLFLNPFAFVVYSLLSVPRFNQDPRRITRCLPVDFTQVQSWLKDLVRAGFLKATAKGYEKQKKQFHVPADSPLCEPHQTLLRQLMQQQIQSLPDGEKYAFKVNFSADPETRDQIQKEFLKFLKAVEPLVQTAPSEEVYGLSFELFRWSYEKNGD